MKSSVLASLFVACLVVAGCASPPSGTSTPPTASAPPADAPRIAPSVAVPTVAKRKVVLSMTGPKAVVEAKDWADFKREWRDTFADHAKQTGVSFTFSDAEVRPTGEDGTMLLVEVADYRMVGIGARIFFGVMTGNAYIDAKVRFSSLRDGTPIGEQQYSTTSSAWSGVFAKVTPQQVDSIAANIFRDFAAAK